VTNVPGRSALGSAFFPSTLGDDGDPLDSLILMEAPVVPGCVVWTRFTGGIEAKQKEKGEIGLKTID
jgi:inorganic pyrophosphatase